MAITFAASVAAASAAAVVAFFVAGAAPAAAQPSFGCTGNLNPTETVICADAGLAALDRQLAATYAQRFDSLPPNQRAALTAAQQSWVAERDSCGTNISCIRNAYLVRTSQLAPAPAAAAAPATPAESLSPNDSACMLVFRNLCPDLADQPNFVGLCYNRNPQVFANIPANCNSTFQTQINQTIPASPAATQANAPLLPHAGMSLGGMVRSGPGMNYGGIGSLAEGVPIKILKDTGLTMDGYNWFAIAWGSRTGYQWGGIMCSNNVKLNGILQVCGQ